MIHWLRPERRFPVDQLAERHQTLSVVGLDIELRQVLGIGPRRVFHLQNDLILVLGFLDQVKVVLRISVAQQRQNSRFRNAISFRLLAPQFNIEIRSVVVEVRRYGQKSRIRHELAHKLLAHFINLIGIIAGDCKGVLTLLLTRGIRTDFQDWKRL